ncbi:MAG: sugar phosphate isomerase/epimerase, partial [Candidatus Omnitrophota bacterium]
RYACDPHLLSNTNHLRRYLAERNLYLSFDSAHMGTKKVDFLEDFTALYETGRILQVHYSDYREGHEHLRPGDGILPLKGLLSYLGKKRFEGGICLELMRNILPEEEKGIVASLKAMLREMKEEVNS